MRKIALLLAAYLTCAASVFAQTTIRGRITDQDGAPVAGATITVKRDQVSTVSGTDGSYQLQSRSSTGQLDISGVGFTPQTVSFSGPGNVDVQLTKRTEQLSEVIVTAMGVRREKR